MPPPGASIRGILGAAWCLVVAAGYLLTQFEQTDTSYAVTLVQQRLEWVYCGFVGLSLVLVLSDLLRAARVRRGPSPT